MAITNRRIWSEVEQTLWDYFRTEVGDSANVKAFIGELPESAYNCWMFEINDGPEPLDAMFVSDRAGNCGRWRMSAMVMGRFTERKDAQYLATVIRTLVPLNANALKNLKWCRPVGEPLLTRVEVESRGKTIPCWQVEYPLEVIMEEDNGD